MPNIGHPAVRDAIDAYNEVVRQVAKEHGIDLIDLSPELRAKELFTDGVHFTVAGNIKRAQMLLPYFLERI